MAKLIIGAHVAMAAKSYLLGSLADAVGYGANALMIYTGAPQNRTRAPIEKLFVAEFQEGCAKQGIDLANVVVHAPYLINMCSANEAVRNDSAVLLRSEMERTAAIGAKYLVLHPGSNGGFAEEAAIQMIADGIDEAAKGIAGVTICLETMAGKGSEVGWKLEQLARIMQLAKTRLGVCLDTCHMHDAGYDIGRPRVLLDEIERTIGLRSVKVIHLNDSKNERGARKDRHENLGYGKVGVEHLIAFANLPEFADAPKILETPWDKDADYYQQEIALVRAARWHDFKGS